MKRPTPEAPSAGESGLGSRYVYRTVVLTILRTSGFYGITRDLHQSPPRFTLRYLGTLCYLPTLWVGTVTSTRLYSIPGNQARTLRTVDRQGSPNPSCFVEFS